MGTCIPVGQVQTRGSPEVPLWDVAKLDLRPDGLLGYPYCQVRDQSAVLCRERDLVKLSQTFPLPMAPLP